MLKKCSKCKEEKDIDEFQKNGYTKAGTPSRRAQCRSCEGKKKAVKARDMIIEGLKVRECISCLYWKELGDEHFEIVKRKGNNIYFRHKCRGCRNGETRDKRHRLKEEDIVMYKCQQMAWSAHSRVFDDSKSYKKGYRNVLNPFGFKDTIEMKNFLYDNFYGDIKELLILRLSPSVDRIDNCIGYTPENIQIIDHYANTCKQ